MTDYSIGYQAFDNIVCVRPEQVLLESNSTINPQNLDVICKPLRNLEKDNTNVITSVKENVDYICSREVTDIVRYLRIQSANNFAKLAAWSEEQ